MSSDDATVQSLHRVRAERAADKILEQGGLAVDSLEGVRLMLCLAYHEGVMDGSEDAVTILRNELARIA